MILVTGGTGFVGRFLVPALAKRGYQVSVLTRQINAVDRWPGVDVCIRQGDLLDPRTLPAALEGVTAVVHLAAVHDEHAPSRLVRASNVEGTAILARTAADAGIQRFIYCSSAAVYGDGIDSGPRAETTCPAPESLYQKTKLEGEVAVAKELSHASVSWVVLRPPALHGPGRPSSIQFLRQILRRPVWIHTPSIVIVTPTYVGDVAAAVLVALERQEVTGEAFNIAGPRVFEYPRFIEFVAQRLGVRVHQLELRSTSVPKAARIAVTLLHRLGAPSLPRLERLARPIVNRSVDISRARRLLGFEPYPLEVGIDETIAWARRERLL